MLKITRLSQGRSAGTKMRLNGKSELSTRGLVRLASGVVVTREEAQPSQGPSARPHAKAFAAAAHPAALAGKQTAQHRLKAVAASPAIKGKEAVALAMLADDEFAGLSASALIKIISKSRAQSRQILTSNPVSRSSIETVDDQRSSRSWSRVMARMNQGQGHKLEGAAATDASRSGGTWSSAVTRLNALHRHS